MRYVVLLSLFTLGCATQSAGPKQSAGGGTPSEIAQPGQPYIYRDGPPPPPEDRSRFQNTVGDNQVRDLEHPGGK